MATTQGRGGILTIPEIAKYLKVTERTIYKLAAARKIPAFKVGGSWRFSQDEIDSWIGRQSRGTNLNSERMRRRGSDQGLKSS
jgi:excisionase family DNA binding protein